MDRLAGAKAPIHLWITGLAALVWNAFGCLDYFMTRTRGAAWIEEMMHTPDADAIMAYIDAFPLWVSAAWALGVWGGLLGAILLLARHRLAVPVFAVSLLGALAGVGYQFVNPSGVAEMNEGINRVMPFVIIAVALGLWLYARAMRAKGVLR